MIGKANATAMIAVKDLDRARAFYEGKLGLETRDDISGEVLTMKSGATMINVYRSESAGTPGLEQQGDGYVAEGMKIAWFKDPYGNILSLFEGE